MCHELFFLGHRETSVSIRPTLSNSFYGGPTVKNQLHNLDRDSRDSTPCISWCSVIAEIIEARLGISARSH